MANSLKNIPLKTFRDYLKWKGCKLIRTKGGHEIWARHDLYRPITIQTHIDPIPEFIVRQILRNLNVTADDYVEFLKS
jgi:predicted RNA binding protein YcfA (HicA-like mRNA interferase family)